MSDPTPNINETAIVQQLILALTAIYAPKHIKDLDRASVFLGAIQGTIALYGAATGRADGWKPSAQEWSDLIALLDGKIAAEEEKIAKLKEEQANAAQP